MRNILIINSEIKAFGTKPSMFTHRFDVG